MTTVFLVLLLMVAAPLGVAMFAVISSVSSFQQGYPIRCLECRTLTYPPCACEALPEVPRAVARRTRACRG